MAGITDETIAVAEKWLVAHDHSLEGIAHPQGEQARFMAAVALELNLLYRSPPETSRLVVECIAYRRSGGKVGDIG
jgi:hypothetical protein